MTSRDDGPRTQTEFLFGDGGLVYKDAISDRESKRLSEKGLGTQPWWSWCDP